MKREVFIDLSAIADAKLTAIVRERFEGCGRNMPRDAQAVRLIARRLTSALDTCGLGPAQRAGRSAYYCGGCEIGRQLDGRPTGALVPVIEFKFADDGHGLIVTRLATTARASVGADILAIGEFKEATPVVWASALGSRRRLN